MEVQGFHDSDNDYDNGNYNPSLKLANHLLNSNKIDNYESIDKIPVRRSERIKKRLKDISPEDIGENDNAKDKDYKG